MAAIWKHEIPVEEEFDADGNLVDFVPLDCGTFTKMREFDTYQEALADLPNWGEVWDDFTNYMTGYATVYPSADTITEVQYRVYRSDEDAAQAVRDSEAGWAHYSGLTVG